MSEKHSQLCQIVEMRFWRSFERKIPLDLYSVIYTAVMGIRVISNLALIDIPRENKPPRPLSIFGTPRPIPRIRPRM